MLFSTLAGVSMTLAGVSMTLTRASMTLAGASIALAGASIVRETLFSGRVEAGGTLKTLAVTLQSNATAADYSHKWLEARSAKASYSSVAMRCLGPNVSRRTLASLEYEALADLSLFHYIPFPASCRRPLFPQHDDTQDDAFRLASRYLFWCGQLILASLTSHRSRGSYSTSLCSSCPRVCSFGSRLAGRVSCWSGETVRHCWACAGQCLVGLRVWVK